jgi:hypothetical protein
MLGERLDFLFRLLFKFAQARLHKPPSALALDDLDAPFISAFLEDLENKRDVGVKTRNLRLTVRTSRRGVRPAMLFPKAILEAEWAADAPFREAMAIKRERLRALRAKRAAK